MGQAIDFQVPTEKEAYTVGRNGMFHIQALSVWCFDRDHGTVEIQGVGQRGKTIRGGFIIEPAHMDELARRWLKARGWTVLPPAADDGGPPQDRETLDAVRLIMEDYCCNCRRRPACYDITDCSYLPLEEEDEEEEEPLCVPS